MSSALWSWSLRFNSTNMETVWPFADFGWFWDHLRYPPRAGLLHHLSCNLWILEHLQTRCLLCSLPLLSVDTFQLDFCLLWELPPNYILGAWYRKGQRKHSISVCLAVPGASWVVEAHSLVRCPEAINWKPNLNVQQDPCENSVLWYKDWGISLLCSGSSV